MYVWRHRENGLYFYTILSRNCNCVILSTNKGIKWTSVLCSHGLNQTFLVPYSYRVTIRNDDSISARGRDRENYWKLLKHFLSLLLSDNLAVVLYFLVLQDKHYIRKLSVSITVSCTRWETGQKSSSNARFSICFS